jgi:hypothetical protein
VASIRRFLADLPGDAAAHGLLALDEPLPPAVKKTRKGAEEPTEGQLRAASEAQAAVTLDEVKASLKAYLDAFGEEACRNMLLAHGANRISDIRPEKYAGIKAGLDELVADFHPNLFD